LQTSALVLSLGLLGVGCGSDEQPGADPVEDGGSDDLQDASDTPEGLKPEQLSGDFLFSVSMNMAPGSPAVFLAQIEAERVDDHLLMRVRQRPLSKADRITPVGEWGEWIDGQLSLDGSFQSDTIHAVIPAAANPIITFDTEVEISLRSDQIGALESEASDARVEFLCGDVVGRILSPIEVDDLSGSHFTATRIADVDDPASYPEVVINCDRDPAKAL
jgi:hypothetical protein